MKRFMILATVFILTACGIKGDPEPVKADAPCVFCE